MTQARPDATWHPSGPAAHAAQLEWPAPYSVARARAWRSELSRRVRADLGELWAQACAAVGLIDDASYSARLPGISLACVGSLARGQIGPYSDLDLVLLHDPARATLSQAALAALAEHLWYPLWDAGIRLDHSVRNLTQCQQVASTNVPAAVGLLDLSHVAGDAELTSQAASALLTDWRRATRRRLAQVTRDAAERAERFRRRRARVPGWGVARAAVRGVARAAGSVPARALARACWTCSSSSSGVALASLTSGRTWTRLACGERGCRDGSRCVTGLSTIRSTPGRWTGTWCVPPPWLPVSVRTIRACRMGAVPHADGASSRAARRGRVRMRTAFDASSCSPHSFMTWARSTR